MESTSNGSNGSASPDSKRKRLTPDSLTRPLSPDSPEIISELQQYAALAAVRETGDNPASTTETQGGSSSSAQGVSAEQLLVMHGLNPGPSLNTPASSQPAESSSSSGRNSRGEGGAAEALDLRGSKRKSSTPACDEQSARKQQQTSKRTSVPLQGYPLTGGYNLPPMGLNPALTNPLLAQMGHPMFMGPGSPYFQAHGQMRDPRLMFADPFSLGGASAPSSSSSSSAAASASMSPFMLSPSLGGMLPGFPLPYGQSLMPEPRMYAPYPSTHLLPGGLPATPGPTGSGYLPGFPPQTEPQILSESDSSGSDDDVIEVTGQ